MKNMPKKLPVKIIEENQATPTAAELLANFLKENHIKLDYSIIEDRMFQTEDGFVLKPKNPLIKVTVSYE